MLSLYTATTTGDKDEQPDQTLSTIHFQSRFVTAEHKMTIV